MITSAGFVLAGTFAVLATIPATFLTELGFAVAFGILLDTIIVRSVLVTALNLDLGRWMWWPSKLAHKPDPAPAELSQERATALTAGLTGQPRGPRETIIFPDGPAGSPRQRKAGSDSPRHRRLHAPPGRDHLRAHHPRASPSAAVADRRSTNRIRRSERRPGRQRGCAC